MNSKTDLQKVAAIVDCLRALKADESADLVAGLIEEVTQLREHVQQQQQARKTAQPSRRFLTVKQFADKYPWATSGGIRHLIFFSETNGFDRCMFRMGRRILLDEDRVIEWITGGKSTEEDKKA